MLRHPLYLSHELGPATQIALTLGAQPPLVAGLNVLIEVPSTHGPAHGRRPARGARRRAGPGVQELRGNDLVHLVYMAAAAARAELDLYAAPSTTRTTPGTG